MASRPDPTKLHGKPPFRSVRTRVSHATSGGDVGRTQQRVWVFWFSRERFLFAQEVSHVYTSSQNHGSPKMGPCNSSYLSNIGYFPLPWLWEKEYTFYELSFCGNGEAYGVDNHISYISCQNEFFGAQPILDRWPGIPLVRNGRASDNRDWASDQVGRWSAV